MPLSGPPLNEPVDLRRLLRTGLATKPDEMALVSAEGGTPGASWTARATGWPRTCSSSAYAEAIGSPRSCPTAMP